MKCSTRFAITLAIWEVFLLASGHIFGTSPDRSVYSKVTSDQPSFVATPPPEMRGFWDGMKWNWFAEEGWRKVGLYCGKYAKNHPDVIRDIMKDRLGDSEAKEMVYSMVVMQLDQENSMPLLRWYAEHGTQQQKIMANDYIADVEEINRHAVFPEGDQYPSNRLPVTNSPVELRQFWKGIDPQWINTWSKTDLLSDYCRKYAKAHPEGSQVKYMMEDLVAHPSEVRDLVYSRLVLAMNPDETKQILTSYSVHGSSSEKLIAGDFLLVVSARDAVKQK